LSTPSLTAAVPTSRREKHVSAYAELSQQVLAAGLLRRRHGYYVTTILLTVAAFAAMWAGVVAVGNSWWVLLLAAALAVVRAQFGFLGHDTAHRQVFASHTWNAWTSRVISCGFAGLSYGWWMGKHNKHHNAPNQEGRDPDIQSGVLAFTPDQARRRTGAAGWFARHQGWAFFPLLTLEGVALHVNSIQALLVKRDIRYRWLELTVIALRVGGFFAVLLLLLPVGKAAAFAGVELGLFGVLLGGSFAPNHKGMPIVPASMKVDFLRRQVLMSRNIRGGRLTDFMMGGLNYQIEHHLFPSMPRPNLKLVQPMVREHCAKHGVLYTETSLAGSYSIVVRYLNRVGLGERDPFTCPLVQLYRG